MSTTNPLSRSVKLVIGVTTTNGAAGTTAISGTAVDMTGFESCRILIPLGPIVGGALTSIKIQVADDSGFSVNVEDVATSSQTIADTDDDKLYYADVVRPARRWLRASVSRGTQAATVGSVIYELYGARELPVTHGSNVTGEVINEAVSGTA